MKKLIPFLLIAFITGTSISVTSCKKIEKRPIGVQLYSLHDDMQKDPVATIEKLGKIGFSFVEAYGYSNGKLFGMEPAAFIVLLIAASRI